MLNATPALVFILMLIAPCAIALIGDRRKAKEAAPAGAKGGPAAQSKRKNVVPPAPLKASSSSIPVFTPPPAAIPPSDARAPRLNTLGRDPYEQAARLYAQPESSMVKPYLREEGLTGTSASAATLATEKADAEVLLAQAAAAKARAAALAEAARAAQAKARQAAEIARQTARDAEEAHRAADYERDVQAQITAQEQARIASGEHLLPESHPSLDFPRSGRGRRTAA